MQFFKKLILNNNFNTLWFSKYFNNFNFIYKKKGLIFFQLKKNLLIYLKFFYIKKLNNNFNFFYIYKNQKKLMDLSFFLIQKLKHNLYELYFKSSAIFLLQGRGFKLLDVKKSLLVLKLGFTHNVNLRINTNLITQILTKNNQKFKVSGNLINIIQLLSCLNFIKKKNVFTSKGVFYLNEKIKIKKTTKTTW